MSVTVSNSPGQSFKKPTFRVPDGRAMRQDNLIDALTGGNMMSGLDAPGLDRTVANRPESFMAGLYRDSLYENLYMSNGLAARVIDLPADDSVTRGFRIEGDPGDELLSEFDRVNFSVRLSDARRWARLFGGSMIIVLTDDSDDLATPMNMSNIGQITDLRVVDVRMISKTGWYYDDATKSNYGMPVSYRVQTSSGWMSYVVHESRCMFISGMPVPGFVKQSLNVPWRGRSALQGCWKDILRYTNALEWTERMLERKQQGVLGMEGLSELLKQTYDPGTNSSFGASIISQRVQMTDTVRSLLNSIAIDAKDSYEVKDLNLNSVPEMFSVYQMSISADTYIPVTTLFGRSPAGHNATGQSDQENYYGFIGQEQKRDNTPIVNRLTTLFMLQRSYTGTRPDNWSVEWNPLWLPSDAEQAKARMDMAQALLSESQALVNLETIQALSVDQIVNYLTMSKMYGLAPDEVGITGPIQQQEIEVHKVEDVPDV